MGFTFVAVLPGYVSRWLFKLKIIGWFTTFIEFPAAYLLAFDCTWSPLCGRGGEPNTVGFFLLGQAFATALIWAAIIIIQDLSTARHYRREAKAYQARREARIAAEAAADLAKLGTWSKNF